MRFIIKGLLAICVVVLLSSCSETEKWLDVQITNHIEDYEVVLIKSGADNQEILIDDNGVGKLSLKNMEKGYASIYYGPYSQLLWLDPDSDISLSFDGENFAKEVSFEGATAQINYYLNKSELQDFMINDCRLDESAFIAKTDSLLSENLRKLDGAELTQKFV